MVKVLLGFTEPDPDFVEVGQCDAVVDAVAVVEPMQKTDVAVHKTKTTPRKHIFYKGLWEIFT